MPGLAALQGRLTAEGGRLYIGAGPEGDLCLAAPQHAVLVLGPPRSGKTSALIIPNVLGAPGPVVATSTKPDVLRTTFAERARVGECWLFDPGGTEPLPPGVRPLRWSPVAASATWDEAILVARALVGAARPDARRGEAGHWTERAEAMLAPMLHAAAGGGGDMRTVLGWVLRHDAATPRAWLTGRGAGVAADVLEGMIATEAREQSGIWSTAAGVLASYRSEAVLQNAARPNFDPGRLWSSRDTVYICAPADRQAAVAPIVVAFLTAARAGAYAQAAGAYRAGRPPGTPLVLALDEVANIAPLPDLPAMVSEAGGQGVLVLACLQDLSQARRLWGAEADGLLTLFGTKVVLGGLADRSTLELVSLLAGEESYAVPSVNRAAWWSRPSRSEGWSMAHRRRLPPSSVRQMPPGAAIVLAGSHPPATVLVPPWWQQAPFAPERQRALPAREAPTRGHGISP